jgi:hypothetical protein
MSAYPAEIPMAMTEAWQHFIGGRRGEPALKGERTLCRSRAERACADLTRWPFSQSARLRAM